MIQAETLKELERPERGISYTLGARMRKVNEIKREVLSRKGRYKEVYLEGQNSKEPAPLRVKEVWVSDSRYIVCLNSKQARKDAIDRAAIVESLRDRIRKNPKQLIGNKGYRKYLKFNRDTLSIDQNKIEAASRFDGKWVLKTNTDLPPEHVAVKYKELWQVEQAFRDLKSVLETRPIYHQRDETIRGHVFCSFFGSCSEKRTQQPT